MLLFAKKWSEKPKKSYLECLNQLVSLLLSPFHNLSSGVSHLQAWFVNATLHMEKYLNKKWQLFQQSNHSHTSSIRKTSPGTSSTLPPLRARPLAVCKPSEPDHKISIFSFHLCSTKIARLKFVADLTDEKDSDPLVVGVVQFLTIMVSFATMTLVGEILKALFLKI